MQGRVSRAVDRLRQPQYTGENRCTPCTVVNVLIGAALGAGLWALAHPLVGAAAFLVSALLVYLRGYLVPGTPTLTKRYLPDRVLAWFDKAPGPADPLVAESEPVDPESVLTDLDAVEPCAEADDLCLTASFESAWDDEIRRLRDEAARRDALADLLAVEELAVETDRGGAAVVSDGTRLGVWPSVGALVADVAADRVLSARSPGWAALDPDKRFRVLAGLRSFLETCPLCDGPVVFGASTVESCCRSWEVVSVHCEACDTGLLELDPQTLETVA